MPHKIEISDKTYGELKEYCKLNGIKIGQYADKLLYEQLMIEKYGDTPFTNYKRKKPEIVEIHVKPENAVEKIEEEIVLHDDGKVEIPEVKPEETAKPKEQPKVTKRRLK